LSVYSKQTKSVLGICEAKAGPGASIQDTIAVTWPRFTGTMWSQSNQWPPPPGDRGDHGGPWSQEYSMDERNKVFIDTGVSFNKRLRGDVVITNNPSFSPPYTPQPLTAVEARGFGTTAIARTEPTAEYFSGAQALGELVADGLPGGASLHLMRDRVALARSSGQNYLNAEFGWLPLVRDVKTLCRAVRRSDDIMTSYIKGSDHRIRRRYGMPSVTVNASTTGQFFLGPEFGSVIYNSTYCQGTTTWKSETKTSFSGAFRYYIPASEATSGIQRAALTARKVYGLELTPEVIWNLAPWSWATDWFGNVGDVMHNVSALGRDGLVLEYGYVMSGQYSERASVAHSKYGTHTRFQKQVNRVRYSRVSPYGFGVSWGGLSPKQLAVVAALGLSRAPF
jgi:hypothetical protein